MVNCMVVFLYMVMTFVGGSDVFHEKVLTGLKSRCPFKHWKVGGGMFLGRNIHHNSDSSIVCDQKNMPRRSQ